MDVVIVLDISNTMNSAPVSGSGSKLDQAKAAANQFVKQFAEEADLTENRRVGVVTFNQNAQVAVALQEVNDVSDYQTNFESQVNAITAPKTPVEIKFTNIEAGLQLANNILAASDAKCKFVILLTDGFPTTYIESARSSTTKIYGYDTYMTHTSGYSTYRAAWMGKNDDGTLIKPGYMANGALGKTCQYGVDYSDYGAQRAQAVAQSMKASGVNIFSVGIDIGGMTIAYYLQVHQGKAFTTVDTNGMGTTYTVGSDSDTEAYKTWLGDKIAGGPMLSGASAVRYSSGDSATELANAYSNILNTIKAAQKTVLDQLYTLDPMSDVADFIGFYDKDGNLSADPNNLTGTAELNGENTAVYGNTGNEDQICWDMRNSGYTMDGQKRVFTLKYRVRLQNEQAGFDFAVGHEMNNKGQATQSADDDKNATLYYSHKFAASGQTVEDGTGSLEYPAPMTEGYEGSLKFQKIDAQTLAGISGVTFTLGHRGQNCSVCGGDAAIGDMTATSDSDGYVTFEHIPSGHEYVLSESAPAGYIPAGEQAVIVSYAETYIGTKTAENKLVDGVLADGTAFTVTNMKVHSHVWSYSAEGDTITATCVGPDGVCTEQPQSVTLVPPEDSTYTGDVNGSAYIEGTIESDTPTLHYTGPNYDSDQPPVDAGTYTVTMSVGDQSVSEQFTIWPKNIENCTVELDESQFIYSGEIPQIHVTCVDNGVGSTVLEQDTDYTVSPVTGQDAGTHQVTVTGTGNYTGTVELEYTIDPKPVTVYAEDQTITYGQTISDTKYTVDGLADGHSATATLTPSTANVTDSGIITPSDAVITAADGKDVTDNYQISYEPGKLVIEPDTAKLEGLTTDNVTSDDAEDIHAVQDMMESAETDKWDEITEDCQELIEKIQAAQDAMDTDNTEKVEDVTDENVKPEDKEALEAAKADLEDALTEYGGNYTEEEKQTIQDEIQRIDDALEALENVQDVTEQIAQLPETVEPADEETAKTILEAKDAYDGLTDHEKTLVDEETKEKLDELVEALTAYEITEGDGNKWTQGSSDGLTVVANGPVGKLTDIQVDGEVVDKEHYDAQTPGTTVTLDPEFLEQLPVGEHTITVVYTDGEASGSFWTQIKPATPATGDEFDVLLHSIVLAVSFAALVVLVLTSKKYKPES